MSIINKSVKRVQKETFSTVVYLLIEKIQEQTLSESEILQCIDDCFEQLHSGKSQRGKSGYNVFVSEKSAEIKANSKEQVLFREMSKKISQMWKEMSKEEKDIYNEKAKNMPLEVKKSCIGTKADGSACSHKAKDNSSFCGQHAPKTEKGNGKKKCEAKTAAKQPCSRNATEGQNLCSMHLKKSTIHSATVPVPLKCMGLSSKNVLCKMNAVDGNYCKRHAKSYGTLPVSSTETFPQSIMIGTEKVTLFSHNGKQYYRGEDTGICFNCSTHVEVGWWDADEEDLIFN